MSDLNNIDKIVEQISSPFKNRNNGFSSEQNLEDNMLSPQVLDQVFQKINLEF
jgi:hypothetical protein